MSKLDEHVVQLGNFIQEIFVRFQNAHSSISRGPHTVLSHHELFLIEVLGDVGSTKMKDAALKVGIAVNTLTGIVDQLEFRGFVTRVRSQTDRRVVFLELTTQGKTIFKSATKAKSEFHRATLSSLSPQERSTLLELFRKMANVEPFRKMANANASSPEPASSAKTKPSKGK